MFKVKLKSNFITSFLFYMYLFSYNKNVYFLNIMNEIVYVNFEKG